MDKKREKILLCVATQKGFEVLKVATEYQNHYSFWVCTFEEKGVTYSYHTSIQQVAQEAGCALLPLEEYRSALPEFVTQEGIQAILCIGWRFLIPHMVIDLLPKGVVIAHDSLLPKFRGFAPLPTALIAGEKETGVTFLLPGKAVDDGPILWQGRVPIEPQDTIADLIEKVIPLYTQGTRLFLENRFPPPIPQDDSLATYSIWRDDIDYYIDWTLDAETIERTVRALGNPYLGARTLLNEQTIIIRKATVLPDIPFAIRQPGKVWSIDSHGRPIVVCGRGLLRIDAADSEGENVLPFKNLRVRLKNYP